MTCEDQRKETWKLIKDEKLVDGITSVIKKTVETGRANIGNDDEADQFKVLITGYCAVL